MPWAPERLRSAGVTVGYLLAACAIAVPASSQLHERNSLSPRGTPSVASSDDALAIARDHWERNRAVYGLGQDDLDGIVLDHRYRTDKSGLTHLYFRQQIGGIDVEGASWVTAVDRDGRILSQGDRLVRGLQGRVETRTPELSADAAVLAAANHLGLTLPTSLGTRSVPGGVERKVVFEPSGLSRDEIPVKLVFVVTEAGPVRIAWSLVIRTPDGRHWWNVFVDAQSAALLKREDWIAQDSYRVYSAPLSSPDEGGRSLALDPADATASPHGWHDTDGLAGAEFTDTQGNNVVAQEDVDGDDAGGFRPDGGAGLVFDFAIVPSLQPGSNQAAVITNLFHWNNYLHDVLYRYGFDEAAGNFQQNNYGKGGLGGDAVRADAQDGSGVDNAQFGTPPDGFEARMEMFLFVQPPSPSLEVSTPPGIAGSYAASPAAFGGATSGLPGSVVQALDPADGAGPSVTDACSTLTNAGAVLGKIAIVDRGTCLFVEKTANVQAAGAIGILVVNNAGDGLVTMAGGDPSLLIPALFLGQSDGSLIQGQLGTGVTATLITPAKRSASLDNSIVAHEYGHGLSNRLTGGSSDVGCLGTAQSGGMGEGWSDWLALTLTAKAADTAIQARSLGTYALGEPTTGTGIRNHPYSRDLGVSPLTLADIATLNQPHGVGEVWASALWDVYGNLVDHYGFDADFHAGVGGNNLLMQVVLDAMKLQPCSPTFLEARDALLTADANANAGVNQCLLWEAFARRGIGVSATSGPSSSTTVTEAFDEPVACQNECGDGLLQPGEQCDDGGTASFDGCGANCRSETPLPAIGGIAQGGTVSVTLDGVVVQVVTSAGQTSSEVFALLAAAINASTALQALYALAAAQSGQAVVTGNLEDFSLGDTGLTLISSRVPALGVAGRAILALLLLLSLGRLSRRRSLA